jgi:hypothetical protein
MLILLRACTILIFSMFRLLTCLLAFIAGVTSSSSSDCVGVAALRPNCPSPEANHRRNAFYVAGRYVYDSKSNGTLVYDQMYVEKLTPASKIKHPHPLVFFHAGGPSGTVSAV